jgi:gas vesicle protein
MIIKGLKKEIKNLGIVYTLVFFLIIIIAITVTVVSSFNPSPENTGLIGAILGGIIAGSLTLLGVYLTLEQQKTKDFLNTYPQFKNNAEEILESIEYLSKSINSTNNKNVKALIESIINFSKKDIDILRVKAIPCGGKIFSEIMKIKKVLTTFIAQAKADVKIVSDGGGGEIISYHASDEKIEELKKELAFSQNRIEEEMNKEEEKFNAFYNL